MSVSLTNSPGRRAAPALRFLLLCLGGWTLLRVLMNWTPAVPAPFAAREATLRVPPPTTVGAPAAVPPVAAQTAAGRPAAALSRRIVVSVAFRGADVRAVSASDMAASRSDAVLPEKIAVADALSRAAPVTVLSPSPQRDTLAGWSLGSWLYLRGGPDAAPGAMAAGGQLGGGQAGARLAYGFGATGRARLWPGDGRAAPPAAARTGVRRRPRAFP